MSRFSLFLSALLMLVAPSTVLAVGVPSPPNCTLPDCLVACPSGDLTFSVTVRDAANVPIPNSTVVIDLVGCPGLEVCPTCPDSYAWDPMLHALYKTTDAAGQVSFSICGGGACDAAIYILADGIQLAVRGLAVVDQDGDLAVNAADVAAVQSKLGTASPSADLDCNGVVDAADEAIVNAHFGDFCDAVVPSRKNTWGTLKQFYR